MGGRFRVVEVRCGWFVANRWFEEGDRGFGLWVWWVYRRDAMRCLICCWLQVYGSNQEGSGTGLRKNMGMADHCAARGLRKKMGIGDHYERER